MFVTSLLMAFDASRFGYQRDDIPGGAMSPRAWFVCGLLLWIVIFPMYLFKRGALKAAGERRREAMASAAASGLVPPGYRSPPTPGPVADLVQMRASGLLSAAEFEEKKAALANQDAVRPARAKKPKDQKDGPRREPKEQAPPQPQTDAHRAIASLAEMKAQGLITEAEYEEKKAQILARM